MHMKDMYAYDIATNSFKNLDVQPKQIERYMNNGMSYENYVPKYHTIDGVSTLNYF